MDITLTEINNDASSFIFQSLPEKIDAKIGTKYQSYSLISGGEVALPNGTEVETVSWDAVFYGASKQNEPMIREWIEPPLCESILRNWQKNKTPLRLLVTDTSINIDVTISDLKFTEIGAYGNIEYSIEFAAYREMKVYTTAETITPTTETTKPRAGTATSSKKTNTYTIKSGDTLWAIAKRFYGNGSQYMQIYNANKELIESAAKKHKRKSSDQGHWIYPGTTITIP